MVSKTFGADEQTCPMRSISEFKIRCGKFKRIGDGIQADCLSDDGYTFAFYFRNETVDQKWLDMGLAPLHARMMHMFSQLEDDGREVNMDNLYNSVKFSRVAFSLKVPQERGEPKRKRIKTQGVIRASRRGVCPEVNQEVPKTKTALEKARGTTKVAGLQNDPDSEHLIIGSCVDQKPFYMLSMAAEKIDWAEKTKMIWSHKEKKEVAHKFLRWSLSDCYNQEMNDCDIADQLRLVYRCLRFLRNSKWWWAEFLWVWETAIVNAYLSMKTYYIAMGVKPRWTHWEFQEKIAWALLDPNGPPTRREKSPTKAPRPTPLPKEKKKHMTMKSLGPAGVYGVRLDMGRHHTPQAVPDHQKKTAVCQLHRLVNKLVNEKTEIPAGTRNGVMICGGCNAAVCLQCW